MQEPTAEKFSPMTEMLLHSRFLARRLQLKLPVKQQLGLVLGANNIFNVDYSDNIRINAFGGRFYEAAPGREVYAQLNYHF